MNGESHDTINTDPLLPDIEFVIELYGLSVTAFSYYACGDPALVAKMRKGMHLRAKRRERVERALSKIQHYGGIPQ